MNPSSKFERLEFLTSKVLDEIASSDEISELEGLIQSHADYRKRYAFLVTQESLLHWESAEVVEYPSIVKEFKLISFPVFSSVAACVAALFCAWTLFFENPDSDLEGSLASNDLVVEKNGAAFSSDSGSKSSSGDASSPRVVANQSLLADFRKKTLVAHAVEVLENNRRFDDDAVVEMHRDHTSWSRINHLSVPAQNGILPFDGNQMIKMSEMSVDVDARIAKVEETLQVLDVRKLPNPAQTKIDAEIFVNNGSSSNHHTTEFKLSVRALHGERGEARISLGSSSNAIVADSDLTSWERLASEFTLPEGTDFLVISLTAQVEGAQALLPHNPGNYADLLSVNFKSSKDSVTAPL